MKISAWNVLAGKIQSITSDGASDLGLKEGDLVSAIVKASSVLIGV